MYENLTKTYLPISKLETIVGLHPYLTFVFLIIVYKIIERVFTSSGKVIDLKTHQSAPYSGVPNSLPWLFPGIRMKVRFLKHGIAIIDEGYQKFGRFGKPYAVRGNFNDYNYLPYDLIDEVKNASDDVLTDEHGEVCSYSISIIFFSLC